MTVRRTAAASAGATVSYSRIGAVVSIVLRREDKLNAFDADLVLALAAALRRFDEDGEARVAVLSGAGKGFSSGADVRQRQCRSNEEFERLGGPQEPESNSADLLRRLVRSKPVIAAVHGFVLGSSLALVLECDLTVAETGTRFQVTETPRGLGGARCYGLMEFLGAGAFAADVSLTGRAFTADEALSSGIISRVAPEGGHVAMANALAEQIAANPPLSVRSVARTRRYRMDRVGREVAALTDAERLYLTEDFQEAVRAFLEKRSPAPFKGR